MYSIFNMVKSISSGINQNPRWMTLKPNLKHNVDKVINYYQHSAKYVNSNHFLIRLIQSIAVPKNQETSRYYDNVDAMALNLSMSLGMTSAIYKGSLYKGIFYGKGNKEILIADNSAFDPYEADLNWETLEPIRVLRHPISDLGFSIPDGRNTSIETGIVVILINIPMLAIQYRAFRKYEEYKQITTGENQKSINQFVYRYPLTNMMRSHCDLVIFNRMLNYFTGAPMGENTDKHPFFLIDCENKLNEYHEGIIDILEKMPKNFNDTLKTVKAISKENMFEVMDLPQIPPTKQVVWALAISMLPMLNLLFSVAKDNPGMRNGNEINNIKRKLHEYQVGGLFTNGLPRDFQEEIQNDMLYINV